MLCDDARVTTGDHTTVPREWLGRVLDTVRLLGATRDLPATLRQIGATVTEVIGFAAVVVNVTQPDGSVRVEVGTGAAEAIVGRSSSLESWEELLARCEPVGSLRYLRHDTDADLLEGFAYVSSSLPVPALDDAGSWHPDDALLAPMRAADGALVGVLSVDDPADGRFPSAEALMVLELFAAQAATAIAEHDHEVDQGDRELLYRVAFEGAPTPMVIVDADLAVVAANDAAAVWLPPGSTGPGAPLSALVDPLDLDEVELACRAARIGGLGRATVEHRLRGTRPVRWSRTHLGRVAGVRAGTRLVLTLEDVTDDRQTIEELRYLAGHDALTGLPNRSTAYDRLGALLDRCGPDEVVAVLAADVDGFKAVNDGLGHLAGDDLLIRVARRLEGALRPGDVLARPGGDEFVVLAAVDRAHADRASVIAQRCVEALRPRFELRSGPVSVSLSVGVVVLAPTPETDPAEVFAAADVALYEAKAAGRDQWRWGLRRV